MDARMVLLGCFCVGFVAVGCGGPKSQPVQKTIFPMLCADEEITRGSLESQHPGSIAYLSVLEHPSRWGLMDRVKKYCPFQCHDPAPSQHARGWGLAKTVDWGPYRIYLVRRCRYNHQVILGTGDGRYHLLMLDLVSGELGEPALEAVSVAGRSILTYRAAAGGNSFQEVCGFFVRQTDGVAAVAVAKTIRSALRKVLPTGCSVWNGGGFDLAELRYEHSVWGPDDCHASPTKGIIRIDFDLMGYELVPRRYCYSPQGAVEFSNLVSFPK